MPRRSITFALLLAVLALPFSDASYGQIYTCKKTDGSMAFTDRPCEFSNSATVDKKNERIGAASPVE